MTVTPPLSFPSSSFLPYTVYLDLTICQALLQASLYFINLKIPFGLSTEHGISHFKFTSQMFIEDRGLTVARRPGAACLRNTARLTHGCVITNQKFN